MFLGPDNSRLPPRLYPWIFVGCDIGSIILQAAGGGVAAAAKKTNASLLDAGNDIMIAGIAFQVVTMGMCGLLGLEFVLRLRKSSRNVPKSEMSVQLVEGNRKFYLFCAGEVLAYITVLIRCIYR